MTDQIPADDLRRFIARCRTAVNGRGSILLDELEALLPAPPRPTLADMTPEERRACTWMQADTESEGRTVILQPNASVGRALMLDQEANLAYAARNEVDLPRMTWPAGTPVSPNTLAVGSVWDDLDDLIAACRKSGRDQVVVTESDGDVSVWNKSIDGWTPSWPTVGYEPFTIIHAGKEADQ